MRKRSSLRTADAFSSNLCRSTALSATDRFHSERHAKRRGNLILLVHELALCALWFHPLVWITSSRLALYRELSCDESVIQSARGGDLASALAKLADPERPFLLQGGGGAPFGLNGFAPTIHHVQIEVGQIPNKERRRILLGERRLLARKPSRQ